MSAFCFRFLPGFLLAFMVHPGSALLAGRMFPPDLQPETLRSPSGQWQLHIDPSHHWGAGTGNYTMRHAGEVAWSGERPWTLLKPTITDTGEVLGHAYTQGEPQLGETVIVILNPDGTTRLEDRFERRFNPILHTFPTPYVAELTPYFAEDLLLVHLAAEFSYEESSIRLYRYSSGDLLADVIPRPLGRVANSQEAHIRGVRPVFGLDLIAVYWKGKYLARAPWEWTLVSTTDGMPVYSFAEDPRSIDDSEIPPDAGYLMLPLEDSEKEQEYIVAWDGGSSLPRVWEHGAIEVTPTPTPPPAAEPGIILPPEVELTPLEPISLHGSEPGTRAARGYIDYRIATDGRIFALHRQTHQTTPTLRVFQPDGTLALEVLVDVPLRTPALVPPVSGDEVLLTTSGSSYGDAGNVYTFDMRTGGYSSLPIEHDRITSAARVGDTLIVLAEFRPRYTSWKELFRYNWQGEVLAHVERSTRREDNRLYFAVDLAVSADDEIATLNNPGGSIRVFDLEGNWLRDLNLETAMGRRPNYLTDIVAADGGWLVRDFNGPSPWVWISADSSTARDITPRYRDGVAFDGILRQAPSGELWAANGERLMQLDGEGRVVQIIGPPLTQGAPEEIESVTMGINGLLYAIDKRTRNVFVYTPDGNLLRTLKPEPDAFPQRVYPPVLSVDSESIVWLHDGRGPSQGRGALRFDADGESLGWFVPENLPRSTTIHAHPTGGYWLKSFREIQRVTADGETATTIVRRADDTWLSIHATFDIAPDGSLAIFGNDGISIHGNDGEPRAWIPLRGSQAARFATRGDIVAAFLRTERAVACYTTEGEPLWLHRLPEDEERWPELLLPPGRNEIWFWYGQLDMDPTIQRYALPE